MPPAEAGIQCLRVFAFLTKWRRYKDNSLPVQL